LDAYNGVGFDVLVAADPPGLQAREFLAAALLLRSAPLAVFAAQCVVNAHAMQELNYCF
jgi:hypothetical protein